MPKRIARLLPNNRETLYGLSRIEDLIFAHLGAGDTDVARIDLGWWLDDGETITAAALADTRGPTWSATHTATAVDVTIAAAHDDGEAKLTVTTSAGRVKVLKLGCVCPSAERHIDDYRILSPISFAP